MENLMSKYRDKIAPKLLSEFKLGNIYEAPRVNKVVVNMGIGSIRGNKEEVEMAKEEVAMLTGQTPSFRKARVSVAGFGVRSGENVGMSVTLRGRRMYDFLDKLFKVVLPRIRDFRGVSRRSFDGGGNYTLGVSEHTVFPEVDLGKVTRVKGLEISIVTSTKSVKRARRLLEELGMPFKKVKYRHGEKV